MAQFKIEFLENKSADWKVATVTDESGKTFQEVSINKTNKKGEPFPNFDGIMSGATIEANFWTSSAGKNYLFAPDKQNATGKKPNMERVMEKKASMIGEAQDKKAQNVSAAQDRNEIMWAKNNASMIIAHHPAFQNLEINEIEQTIINLADRILNATLNPF